MKEKINILLLLDSFKGSISSLELSKFIKSNLEDDNINVSYYPLSDGGENFLSLIKFIYKINNNFNEIKELTFKVSSLINDIKVDVPVLIDINKKVGYLETSTIVGLELFNKLSKEKLNNKYVDIFNRTSKGIGEILLILDKLNLINTLYLSLGGSAINDLGIGLLKSLNATFFDLNDNKINKDLYINDIKNIKRIDLSTIKNLSFKINLINDVNNPLLGLSGANFIYAKQKILTPSFNNLEYKNKYLLDTINTLESYFTKFNDLVSNSIYFYNKSSAKGDGSSGGLGYIFNHIIKDTSYFQGINFFLDYVNFKDIKNKYSFIISGEGKLDYSSILNNKVIGGILSYLDINKVKNKLILIVGSNEINISDDVFNKIKPFIKNIYPIYKTYSSNLIEAITNPKKFILEIIKDIKKNDLN